ncbi:MAG: hypothetical protein LLG04_16785 [Parachlamydia sp.]|nr:hypothetical protein [Parachlamydia sp.]
MKPETKMQLLRYALIAFGLFLILGIYPAMQFWPSGWRWEPNQVHYEQMILGIYATLGVFLLLASRDPLANRSLIWFTVWSSLVHATIMLFQAFQTKEYGHLYADIPALYLVAIILGGLMPAAPAEKSSRNSPSP